MKIKIRKMEVKIAVIAFILSSFVYCLLGYGLGIDYFKFYSEQKIAITTAHWFNLSPVVIALIASMLYHWKNKKVCE
ncbi:hypothetical protein N1I86_01190 [Bacillus sp. FSL W8-0116]|uniref:hypothetical protein n=1 Tax=Bacillus sp. FSL W8-0116 TaxID=2978206 RepID=UPI0030F7C1C6